MCIFFQVDMSGIFWEMIFICICTTDLWLDFQRTAKYVLYIYGPEASDFSLIS